jgi:hypothetical protein
MFVFLDPQDEIFSTYLNREFNLNFQGNDFECRFSEPTARFMDIAKRTTTVPSDDTGRTVPQLPAFRDFQRLDELSERGKKYFEGKVPRNFFVKSIRDVNKIDLITLAKHLNFITNYFDRRSPVISIREDNSNKTNNETFFPRRFLETDFPTNIALDGLDEIILQLIRVANPPATPRQAFIYYYQVLEYAGHYFVDEKIKTQLRKFLRDPSLISCDERKIGELFSLLTESNHNDEVKMRRMIEDVVDPLIIWREIEHDKSFFAKELQFEGGFILPALIGKDTTPETWKTMWTPKLFDQLTKIRNCLVHARERRENRVILPTVHNNRYVRRYLPVIARVAQQIAIASRG